jgi:hypothetical protein
VTKGKHAASANKRRYEMAMEHIDRLTDDLANAKVRVKKVEAAANSVPALQERIEYLTNQIALGTSDELEHQRKLYEHRIAELDADLVGTRDTANRLMLRVCEVMGERDPWIPKELLEQLHKYNLVDWLSDLHGANRQLRRVRSTHKTTADRGEHNVQDNRKTFAQNWDQIHGGAA